MIALADWVSAAQPPLALVQLDGGIRFCNQAFMNLPGDAVCAAQSRRARAALRLAARLGALQVRLEGAWSSWRAEARATRAADGALLLAVAFDSAPAAQDDHVARMMRLTASESAGLWRVDRRGRWLWAADRLGGALLVGQMAPDGVAAAARRGEGFVDQLASLPQGGCRTGWFNNGGEVWLLTARPVFDAAGRFDGLIGLARAACGRARASQAFERMVRAAAAADPGFALYDRDGRLRLASDGYLRVFDADSVHLSLGACDGDLLAEVTAGERRPPELGEQLRFFMTTSAGRRLEVHRLGVECGGWTETVMDVTPQRAAERAMETATRMLQEESTAKSVFVQSFTDELVSATKQIGSDLIALRAAADALGAATDQYADGVDMIGQGFRRLRQVSGGVRALNDLDAPWAQLEPMRFDLGLLVVAAEASAKAYGGEGRLQVAAKSSAVIEADARMVGMAMDQLISNALKFTPADGRVRVSIEPRRDGGVALVVADNGVGVAPEHLPKLTEPFFQVENDATLRNYEGAGIGLSLCASVMRLHGGRLELEGGLGDGLRAALVFPADRHILCADTDRQCCLRPIANG